MKPTKENNEIIRIFMERDGLTEEEAQDNLKYMQEAVDEGEDPEDVLYDEGLEPDYIFDLLA